MRKILTALAAAAALAAIVPQPADARCDACLVGAGIAGGLLIGSAIANSGHPPDYYHPQYYGPSFGAHPHRYTDECYYRRAQIWDQYSGQWVPGPKQLVCPP